MLPLLIFNSILIVIIVIGLIFTKKFTVSERAKNIMLIIASFITVLCHYSSLLYHHLSDGTAIGYLRSNPNLVLPIYPCNVVMWSCVIYGLLKNKDSRFGRFLCDYIFWFGIISTLVGMFANIDFINNPTLANYDTVKGIVAHATLLFNVLLMPTFGRIKVEMKANMLHIIIAIVEMLIIGLYCNLMFFTLVSKELAYEVNSMFLIHSPFEGVSFLTYPIIALIALPVYFAVFAVCEIFAYKKGERFYDRYRKNPRKTPEN